MSKQAARLTRKEKSVEDKPLTRNKFNGETEKKLMERFTPTDSQKVLINKIRENTITFVDAEAGVGKTSAILYHFCKEYIENPYKQIIVLRTPVEVGSDKIGFLPNSLGEKLAPHYASTKEILEGFLTKGKVETDLGVRIHFKIPNYVLGATFNNSLILIDEAQQLQPAILKLLLERTGKDSKVVVAGCSNQLYGTGKDRNALADAMGRFFVNKDGVWHSKYEDVAIHEFDIEDIQRSEIVKTVIRAYKGIGGI
jgi:phosphate starvation-inducible protein PhoH